MHAVSDTWTASDGTELGRAWWLPEGPLRARLISLHGLSCRAVDIAPLAERLSDRGIAVEAWNLRGQGLDPQISRRGAWLEVEGMSADFEAFAGPPDGKTPLFLSGGSMGALLALQAAVRPPWPERLAGLLLFVPVSDLAQRNPPWVKSVLGGLSRVFPNVRLRPGWFVQGHGGMPILTRIPEEQTAIATAPHRLGPTTLGFLKSMGDLIEAANTVAPKLRVPVAMFSVGHDVFITPAQQEEFFRRVGSVDKTHFHYPESYHELLRDLDAAQIVDDAMNWIEARLATRTSPR